VIDRQVASALYLGRNLPD